jgi:hypothetical protein
VIHYAWNGKETACAKIISGANANATIVPTDVNCESCRVVLWRVSQARLYDEARRWTPPGVQDMGNWIPVEVTDEDSEDRTA